MRTMCSAVLVGLTGNAGIFCQLVNTSGVCELTSCLFNCLWQIKFVLLLDFIMKWVISQVRRRHTKNCSVFVDWNDTTAGFVSKKWNLWDGISVICHWPFLVFLLSENWLQKKKGNNATFSKLTMVCPGVDVCVCVLLMADSIKCWGFPSVSLIIKGLKMTMMATDMKQTKGNVRSTHFLLLWAEREKNGEHRISNDSRFLSLPYCGNWSVEENISPEKQ